MEMKRIPHVTLIVLATLCLITMLPTRATAWGDRGHRIVAEIAERYLTDRTRQAISQLIKNDPQFGVCFDPITKDKYPTATLGDKMACLAPWPDPPLKYDRPYSSNWHFVDIPAKLSDPNNPMLFSYDEARDCRMDDKRGDCAVLALKRLILILGNAKQSPGDYRELDSNREEAFKFIVHIIGDIHQPLHCITDKKDPNSENDNGDIGGNLKIVQWLGVDANPTWKDQWNLHSVWDEGIIDQTMQRKNQKESDFLKVLLDKIPAQGTPEFKEMQEGDTQAWLKESYQLAIGQAYGELPPFDKDYPYKTKNGSERKGGYRLKEEYYLANRDVVEDQLRKAGVRLAGVLNELLGK